MEFINTIFGIPLGYILYYCLMVIKNYGLSIILFTLLVKVVMFPVSIVAQKNSIKMVKMQPMIDDIKLRYANEPEALLKEQRKLYKKEKYSSAAGIVPLAIQIPIILGLINVIYNPLQHLIHLNKETIATLIEKAAEISGESMDAVGAQLTTMELMQSNPSAFAGIVDNGVMEQIQSVDFYFLGLNLSQIPSFSSILVIIPLIAGLSSLALSVLQNRHNVLQKEQGFLGRWGMATFLVVFSLYFAFVVPAGVGLYWTASNVFSIGVMYLCNFLYDPKKYIDYENRTIVPKLTAAEKKEQRKENKIIKELSKVDSKKFFETEKQLMFYSEGAGFYKYFSEIIEYLLDNTDITIHYVTSDRNDPILNNENDQLKSYFIAGNTLIPFFMKIDADMVIMTMPDLDQYHIKRSIVNKNAEYIYLGHGMGSYHISLREHALDAFDTIFCYGPHHNKEIRALESLNESKEKNCVNAGYGLLDVLLDRVSKLPDTKNPIPQILIAPSWQKDNILENGIDQILEPLLKENYKIILRPHPEFIKRFQGRMTLLEEKYKDYIGDNFIIEKDFSSNETVYLSDILITDWSGIGQEFAYATKKPSIFINTPMKVMNMNYKKTNIVPQDISLRDKIGVSLDMDELSNITTVIKECLENTDRYKEKITKVMNEGMYNIGSAGRVASEYIISRLNSNEVKVNNKETRDTK